MSRPMPRMEECKHNTYGRQGVSTAIYRMSYLKNELFIERNSGGEGEELGVPIYRIELCATWRCLRREGVYKYIKNIHKHA